jgi:hypothetical protein
MNCVPSWFPCTRRSFRLVSLSRNLAVSGALRSQAARSWNLGVSAKPNARQYCMSSCRKSGSKSNADSSDSMVTSSWGSGVGFGDVSWSSSERRPNVCGAAIHQYDASWLARELTAACPTIVARTRLEGKHQLVKYHLHCGLRCSFWHSLDLERKLFFSQYMAQSFCL